jgi:hypothetical protein
MHRISLVGMLALLVGCQANHATTSATPRFRVESAIEPAEQLDSFVVTTKILELRDGTWQTTVMPRMTIHSGQSAYVIIDGDRTLRVDATASGDAAQANGSVKIDVSKHGRTLYGCEQQLALATRRG